jgi:hypothetical protein
MQAFNVAHAFVVFLAHGREVSVDLLPAARDAAARGLVGPDALEDLHHIDPRFGGLHGDEDPSWGQVHARVKRQRAVRAQRALDFHYLSAHGRLLPKTHLAVDDADRRIRTPAELRLPSSLSSVADPAKLQRRIAKYSKSVDGMPSLLA